ncbi:unnamed protein product [Caenorhabditis bovis]|uniref:VWFA domain-containing protein n=1 Tax=Caenorhabditis bovis TaxID=2654633 RepID=A0A8S1EF83_9PELO|nr:unnamed protein product [Caenorhabditis bovis]
MKFFHILLAINVANSQYVSEPLLYSAPGVKPDSSSYNNPEHSIRPTPIATWVQRLNEGEDAENNLDGSGSGLPETIEVEGSAAGEGSATRPKGIDNHASGEGADDFDLLMSKMDKNMFDSGIACPSDVMFVVDATSSVKDIFNQSIIYLRKVVEGLDVSDLIDHVGVIVYSSGKKQKLKIRLGQYNKRSDLDKAITDLPFFSGITATGEALKFAADHSEDRRNNVTLNYVVLTDGYSYDLIEQGARKLRSIPNSEVFAVAVGDSFVKNELEMITSNPDNVLYGPTSYGTLVRKIKRCQAKLDFQRDEEVETITVRYIPTATDSQGRHLIPSPRYTKNGVIHFNDKVILTKEQIAEIEKQISLNNLSAIPTTEEPLLTKDCEYDLGIIFDASGSLMQNFQKQLKLADKLIEQLPISENDTHVGIIQYAGRTKIRVLSSFDVFSPKASIKKTIMSAKFFSGTTFTNQALNRMANLYKNSKRKNAHKQMVIFTDGYSAEDTSQGIELLKSLGVTIYTVGITDGTNINTLELEEMATSPNYYFEVNQFDDLLQHFPSTQYC